MGAVERLCGVQRTILEALDGLGPMLIDPALKELITEQMAILDRDIVQISLTTEALDPIFETGNGRGGVLSVLDLAYNAFMMGRNMENREDGGRTAWFTDCHPLMQAGVDRLKKETLERMEYAKRDRVRSIESATKGSQTSMSPEQIDAGAACVYGYLDPDFQFGARISWPQVNHRVAAKYRAAFAASVAAAETAEKAAA